MKKKLVSLVTILAMLCAFVPTIAFAETSGTCGADGDNLTWTLDDEGTLTISGTGDMADYSSIGIPWYSKIGLIKTVILQDGIESIGSNAFHGCNLLTYITIPETVTSIGGFAFYGCTSLVDITIPSNVTQIESYTFCDCDSLTSIIIPDSVTLIGDFAFCACDSLEYVKMSTGVIDIGDRVFYMCSSLTSITIPDGVTLIGYEAFDSCESLTNVIIPNSVTTIARMAFYNCTNLTDVYYFGSEEEWNNISIGSYNEPLISATIHYNCKKFTMLNDNYSFSNSNYSFDYDKDYKIPLKQYTDVLGLTNGVQRWNDVDTWGGSCYGFAATAGLFFINVLDYNVYDSKASNLYSISAPRSTMSNLTILIEKYYVVQFSNSTTKERDDNSNQNDNNNQEDNNNPIDTILKAVEHFENTGEDPIILCIYRIDSNGKEHGHAVVPYKVVVNADGSYSVYVYDCNYPKKPTEYLLLTIQKTNFSMAFIIMK